MISMEASRTLVDLLKKLSFTIITIVSAFIFLGCSAQPADETELEDIELLKALTIDQNTFTFTLEDTELRLSGDCNVLDGNINLRMGANEFSSACSSTGFWAIILTHSDLDSIGNNLDFTLTQEGSADELEVSGLNETISYVCDNDSAANISSRGLDGDCNIHEVGQIQGDSGVQVNEDILPDGCEPNCPSVDSEGNIDFEGTDEPIQVDSSPELNADEALAIFMNINWVGSVQTYAGGAASVLLEKGQSDDDNYGIYILENNGRFCFEYRTESNAFRTHCLTNVVDVGESHSLGVVYSFADQEVRMYVDGVMIQSFAETERLRDNDFPLTVGQQNYPGNEFAFIGSIGDLSVLTEVLSDEDIALLHNVTND